MTEHEHEHELPEIFVVGGGNIPPEIMEKIGDMVQGVMRDITSTGLSEMIKQRWGGWMFETLSGPKDPQHPENKDTDELDQDHKDFNILIDRMSYLGDKPVDEWTDGEKLRTAALLLYGLELGEGGCIHYDTAMRDFLAMADRLDALDLSEESVRQYDFDADYQDGFAGDDEGEEE